MSDRDIIDDIDALVDEQMAGGEPIGGYDYDDPNYPQCPHCGDDWHGLKITRRMRDMRWDGAFDENYRYADDDSEVECPGSDFIGPWARVWQVEMMRTEKYGTLPPGVEWRDPILPTRRTRQDGPPWVRWHGGGCDCSECRRVNWTVEVGGRALGREHGVESFGFTYHLPADIDRVVSAVLPQAAWLSCGASVDPEAAPEALQRMPATTEQESGEMLECMVPARSAGRHTALLEALNTHRRAGGDGPPVAYATGGRIPTPETREERALPHPSITPPMWANDPTRTRRQRNR